MINTQLNPKHQQIEIVVKTKNHIWLQHSSLVGTSEIFVNSTIHATFAYFYVEESRALHIYSSTLSKIKTPDYKLSYFSTVENSSSTYTYNYVSFGLGFKHISQRLHYFSRNTSYNTAENSYYQTVFQFVRL